MPGVPSNRAEFEANMAAMGYARVEIATAGPYSLVKRGDSYGFTVEDNRGIGIRPRVVLSILPASFDVGRYRIRSSDGESRSFQDPAEAFLWWAERYRPD